MRTGAEVPVSSAGLVRPSPNDQNSAGASIGPSACGTTATGQDA